MKTLKNTARTLMLTIGTGILSAQIAFAQVDFNSAMTSATTTLKDAGGTVINVASIILGLVAAVRLVPIFIKRGKQEGQTSELLSDWGFTLIYVLLGMQVVRLVFFS